MSEASPSLLPPHPAQVLSAYLEPHARGRRVAVLGDATLGLAEALLERGARAAHVFDVDPGRVAEALTRAAADRSRPAPVFTAASSELGGREGGFDLVVVPDLASLGAPEATVERARRLLGSGAGIAVFAAPNPDVEQQLLPLGHRTSSAALGYYELFDAVSARFAEVRMLGQAPFVGYALVDFSVEDPDVAIDTSLLAEPELPEWYVAIASDRAVRVESYALLELPVETVTGSMELARHREPITLPGDRTRAAGARAQLEEQAVALTEARARIAMLGAELERLRESAAESLRAARSRDELSLRVAELEKQLEDARTRARDTELALADEKGRAGELGSEILRLEDELSRQRARVARERDASSTAQELATAKARLVKLEAELDEVEAERDAILARADELEAKLDAVEPPTLRSRESAIKLAAVEAKLAEVEAKLATATEAAKSESKRASEALARAEKAEKELAASQSVKAEALRQAKESDAKRDEVRTRLASLEAELDALRSTAADANARAEHLEKQLASRPEEPSLEAAHAEEVDRLEQALRSSGARVAELTRELREAERVGRELLFELESSRLVASHAATGTGSPTNGGGTSVGSTELLSARAALEDLAERAARAEADLVASRWKVAQLERSIALQPAPTSGGDDPRLAVLERALALAQREIAELRVGGPASDQRAALEQAVLLEQAERKPSGAERAG